MHYPFSLHISLLASAASLMLLWPRLCRIDPGLFWEGTALWPAPARPAFRSYNPTAFSLRANTYLMGERASLEFAEVNNATKNKLIAKMAALSPQ